MNFCEDCFWYESEEMYCFRCGCHSYDKSNCELWEPKKAELPKKETSHTVVIAGNCTVCGRPLEDGNLFLCKECRKRSIEDAETKTTISDSGGDAGQG